MLDQTLILFLISESALDQSRWFRWFGRLELKLKEPRRSESLGLAHSYRRSMQGPCLMSFCHLSLGSSLSAHPLSPHQQLHT